MAIPETQTLIINFVELVAVILATIYFKNYKNTPEKYFLYFLWYVVFTEFFGIFWGYVLKINNNWIFNIYFIVSFLFIAFWYYKIIKSKALKRIILFFVIIYLGVFIHQSITIGWKYYLRKPYYIAAVMILIATVFYFYELLNSDKILNLKNNLRFWLATGTLLFNIGLIPFMFFSEEMKAVNPRRMLILMVLNIILYGCYSLGFIWSKPHQETSL